MRNLVSVVACLLLSLLGASAVASAQERRIPSFVMDVHLGAFRPKADSFRFTNGKDYSCSNCVLDVPFNPLQASVGGGINVGYRPEFARRLLQFDVGWNAAPDADPAQRSGVLVDSQGRRLGTGHAAAFVDFWAFDSRLVVPLLKNKGMLLTVGGGTNYMTDRDRPLEDNVATCQVCAESRNGWGRYGTAEVTAFFHHSGEDGGDTAMGVSFHVQVLNANLNTKGNAYDYGKTSQRVTVWGVSLTMQPGGK